MAFARAENLVRYWRRLDVEGFERLELVVEPDGITASGTVISVDQGGFRLDHRWRLDPDWRAQSIIVERWNADGRGAVSLERDGAGWRVDGVARPELDNAQEPDLSVTPFCNALPIRRAPPNPGQGAPLDVAYIDGAKLTVARSRQRYDRQGSRQFRYVDLGLSSGFEADLAVDEFGLVVTYEHLFTRVTPGA